MSTFRVMLVALIVYQSWEGGGITQQAWPVHAAQTVDVLYSNLIAQMASSSFSESFKCCGRLFHAASVKVEDIFPFCPLIIGCGISPLARRRGGWDDRATSGEVA